MISRPRREPSLRGRFCSVSRCVRQNAGNPHSNQASRVASAPGLWVPHSGHGPQQLPDLILNRRTQRGITATQVNFSTRDSDDSSSGPCLLEPRDWLGIKSVQSVNKLSILEETQFGEEWSTDFADLHRFQSLGGGSCGGWQSPRCGP